LVQCTQMSVDGSPQMLHVIVAVSVISLFCFLYSAVLIHKKGTDHSVPLPISQNLVKWGLTTLSHFQLVKTSKGPLVDRAVCPLFTATTS
jgi:hypothetical protein